MPFLILNRDFDVDEESVLDRSTAELQWGPECNRFKTAGRINDSNVSTLLHPLKLSSSRQLLRASLQVGCQTPTHGDFVSHRCLLRSTNELLRQFSFATMAPVGDDCKLLSTIRFIANRQSEVTVDFSITKYLSQRKY